MAGVMLAIGLAACIEITVDGDGPGSIEFVPLAYPSVNAGDTLRDHAGAIAPLSAKVYKADGSLDDEAVVTFLTLDSTVTIAGRFLIGKALGTASTATARLIATTDGVQSSPRSITVVPTPDSLARSDTTTFYSTRYSFPPSTTDTFPSLAVRVTRKSNTTVAGVPGYVVTWAVRKGTQAVTVTDTTGSFFLADDQGRVSLVDTTDGAGLASRRLIFRLRSGKPSQDTVEVLANVRRGTSIPTGDPIAWTVRVLPRGVTP